MSMSKRKEIKEFNDFKELTTMRFGDIDVDAGWARSVDRETFIGRLMAHSLKGIDDKRQFLSDVYGRLNPTNEAEKPAKAATKKVNKTV